MNIYEKLLAITTELNTVAKNLTVQQTKTQSYKAVSERDILDAVKPLEDKYKVYSYPVKRTILESNMLESESEWNNKITKKTTFMTRIETVYRFVNVEEPSEFTETIVFSEGIDSQDKGSGKAMTYADKYALMKAYKISTGDDPDQTSSVEEKYTKADEKDEPTEHTSPMITENQLKVINGYPEKTIEWILTNYQVSILQDLSRSQATAIIKRVAEAKKAKEESNE